MNWDDLKFLLALHREGSLASAARSLGVDQSTVSRRVAALEKSLGTLLLARTPDGLEFTETGLDVVRAAVQIEGVANTIVANRGGEDGRIDGIVRVTCTDSIAPFVIRGLQPLRERHAALQVDVIASSDALDLRRREADIAVRLYRDNRDGLITRKLGEIAWSLYASTNYLARRPVNLASSGLAGHDVLHFSGTLARAPGALWLDAHGAGANVVFRGNGPRTVLEAARAGLGVACLPCFLCGPDRGLVRVTPEALATSEAFAMFVPELRTVARVRVVVDRLVAWFAAERELLRGA